MTDGPFHQLSYMFSDKPDRPTRSGRSDDVYEGFNELSSATTRIMSTVAKASNQGKPPGSIRPPAGPMSTQMRAPQGTLARQGSSGANAGVGNAFTKQLSSVRGAGFSSKPQGTVSNTALATQRFDPFAPTNTANAPPLAKKTQESAEEQAREMEERVNALLEETMELLQSGNSSDALSRARESVKRERQLVQHREKNNSSDQINTDLTFAVGFNLAQCQQACGMHDDALRSYTTLLQDQNHTLAARVRVNMGAVYVAQKRYKEAVKQWRICIDEISANEGYGSLVYRIQRNIALAQLKMGSFVDAAETLATLCEDEQHRDAQTCFDLLVCEYAVGDTLQMKRVFLLLLDLCDLGEEELVAPIPPTPLTGVTEQTSALTAAQREYMCKYDELFRFRRERQRKLHEYVRTSARLIAPAICASVAEGYDWIIDALRSHKSTNNGAGSGLGAGAGNSLGSSGDLNPISSIVCHTNAYGTVALEVEMCKGLAFLKRQDLPGAYAVFQQMEKREEGLLDHAATNLSFLYWLEGDLARAEAKADAAVRVDRYNARALVNKANALLARGEAEAAREVYLEAVGVEADCAEAIYNLGLCNCRLGQWEDALQAFRKVHRLTPSDAQALWQLARVSDALGRGSDAMHWLQVLVGAVERDAGALATLGSVTCRYGSEAEAAGHFRAAFAAHGVNAEVLSWLGVWHVKQQQYHAALGYFARACDLAPHDSKWRLMIAACHRRLGDVGAALALYERILASDPGNIECLRYLCVLGREVGHAKTEEWCGLLAEAERRQAREEMEVRAAIGEGYGGYGYDGEEEDQGPRGGWSVGERERDEREKAEEGELEEEVEEEEHGWRQQRPGGINPNASTSAARGMGNMEGVRREMGAYSASDLDLSGRTHSEHIPSPKLPLLAPITPTALSSTSPLNINNNNTNNNTAAPVAKPPVSHFLRGEVDAVAEAASKTMATGGAAADWGDLDDDLLPM